MNTKDRDDETGKKTRATLCEATILQPYFVSSPCFPNRCWYRGEYNCAVPAPNTSLRAVKIGGRHASRVVNPLTWGNPSWLGLPTV